ncbi:hypothetical protein [Bradyrhizobium sp. LMTR 3]|uniref:hypothetical protein n=1 Tax=Bradyrhizobium sp. LMTR 3 TaxID=189873 RepID=UPI001147533B|nr:hypothetical protein [Bradyrhizobium sp. LMTR 3]
MTALRDFSRVNADMKFAANSLGFTTQQLKAFQRAFEGVRIDPSQSLAALQTFAKNAEDFKLRIGGLRDELHNPGAGDVVEAIARAGSTTDALRIAFQRMQELQRKNPAVAKRFADSMFGTAAAARLTWQDLEKANAEIAKSGTLAKDQIEASEKFRLQWEKLGNTLDDIKTKALSGMFPTFTRGLEAINTAIEKTISGFEKLRNMFGPSENQSPRGGYKPPAGGSSGDFWDRLLNPGNPRTGGRAIPQSFRQTDDELGKFADNLRKANFQFERGLSGGNTGGMINASFGGSSGAARGGGFGGFGGFGGGGYSVIPEMGGGNRSMFGTGRNGLGGAVPSLDGGGRSPFDTNRAGSVTSDSTGSAYLAERRARFKQELEANPALREKLAAIAHSEGARNPRRVVESLFNRADYANKPLADMMTGRFYGPIRRGELPAHIERLRRNPALAGQMNRAIDQAFTSNELEGATDQGMRSDPNGWYMGGRKEFRGDTNIYNDWGGGPGGHAGARRFREAMQARINEERRRIGANVDADISRSRIDGAIGTSAGAVKAEGSVNVSVHAPSGTKVDAKSDGFFQKTSIQRYRQMTETGLDGGAQ